MSRPGLRLLSLDGGGTRGLTTLYILRELMNSIVPGNGGKVRPYEYFDLIGGAGLSGLCTLLFVRFSYSIDQAIEFLLELLEKLDDVENFRLQVLREEVEDVDRWLDCVEEFRMPEEQLEALRQGLVQESWASVIKSNITDGLERYPHMENDEFNYKSPSAVIETGRQKAFVVSSESEGYSRDREFTDGHRYNVPILHRTYECRHGDTLYTFYAVGLATVAYPNIMKPGVVFPDFLATGKHTTHNPVRLVLEEANLLWPGLPVATITSIGTGTFELYETLSNSLSSTAANAGLRICEENKKLAADLKKLVLPFDKKLAIAYSRLDTTTSSPFREFAASRMIQSEVIRGLTTPKGATNIANIVNVLRRESFPTVPEDLVVLASLSQLLKALSLAGYSTEAEIITDVISNYILYEAASGEDGSFQKLSLATQVEEIASMVTQLNAEIESNRMKKSSDIRSEAMLLNGSMAFGDSVKGGPRHPGTLVTLSDFAAGIYYTLTILRREGSPTDLDPKLRNILQQLPQLGDTYQEGIGHLISRLELLLELVALAALCEAAMIETLRGYKGLSQNSYLIRRVHNAILNTPLQHIGHQITGPFANLFTLSIQSNKWSTFRDDAICALLDSAATKQDVNWSLVNLALVRSNLESTLPPDPRGNQQVVSTCEAFPTMFTREWLTKSSKVLGISINDGYLGLVRKYLRGEELGRVSRNPRLSQHNYIDTGSKETAFHQAARLGFPHVMKTILDAQGMEQSRAIINQKNAQGRTALHLACIHRAPEEIFTLLFILGASTNIQCNLGRAPLHCCFPDPKLLPPVYDPLANMVSEFSLPTTAPYDMRTEPALSGKGEPIEPHVYETRRITNQLLSHRADFTITDLEGKTPLHSAAQNGYSSSLHLFFHLSPTHTENLKLKSLTIVDKSGLTILDHARNSGSKNGEAMLISEMHKRGLPISEKPASALMNLETQFMIMKIPAPRTALPEPGPEDPAWANRYKPPPLPPSPSLLQPVPRHAPPPYSAPGNPYGQSPSPSPSPGLTHPIPSPGPSPSQQAPRWENTHLPAPSPNLLPPQQPSPAPSTPRFSPVYVYHDPDVIATSSNELQLSGADFKEKDDPQPSTIIQHQPQSAKLDGWDEKKSGSASTNTWTSPSSTPHRASEIRAPTIAPPSPRPDMLETEGRPKSRFFDRLRKGKERERDR